MAPITLRPIELRALRRLKAIGPATLRKWKRAHKRHDGVKLQSKVVHRLWFLRLVSFGWFTDLYDITDSGRRAACAAAPPLPF